VRRNVLVFSDLKSPKFCLLFCFLCQLLCCSKTTNLI
jgi:hypothetical protein